MLGHVRVVTVRDLGPGAGCLDMDPEGEDTNLGVVCPYVTIYDRNCLRSMCFSVMVE